MLSCLSNFNNERRRKLNTVGMRWTGACALDRGLGRSRYSPALWKAVTLHKHPGWDERKPVGLALLARENRFTHSFLVSQNTHCQTQSTRGNAASPLA